ncbi:MAG: hypothetical protein ACXAC7_03655 [Candidatus Hodarchaeales archaeon]|jgi:phosphomannomutase
MEFSIDEGRIVGHTDETLFPEFATKLGLALGTFFGKGSIIATTRDFRKDSRMLKRSLSGGLMGTGVDILDLHAAPTSTLQFVVRRFGASGGISFTGAHYLEGEISIRILDSTGNEIEHENLNKIFDIALNGNFARVSRNEIGIHDTIENSMDIYHKALMNFVKNDTIAKANFRLIVDCSLGPVASVVPNIFSDLNIDIVTMNAHRIAPQEVLPNPQSIQRVSKAITAINADLGFIIDVEGVKLVALDNEGQIIPPEDLCALLIWQNLQTRKGPVVLSKLFTHRFDEVFESLGAKIVRTEDSPGNIGRQISLERAVIGATDNGKLYNPIWGAETDGTLSALTLLQDMEQRQENLADLIKYFENHRSRAEKVSRMITKIPLPSKVSQLEFFRKLTRNGTFMRDTLVGIKLEVMSGFGHFMSSTIEKEVQLIVETPISQDFASICDRCQELAENTINELKSS